MKHYWAGYEIANHTGGHNHWRVNVGNVPYMGTLEGCKAWIRRRGWLYVKRDVLPPYSIGQEPHGRSLQWVVRLRGKKVAAFLDEEDAVGWVIGKEQGKTYGD